jgi:hypothetical protein
MHCRMYVDHAMEVRADDANLLPNHIIDAHIHSFNMNVNVRDMRMSGVP